jgi:hypothetical protein
MTLSPDDLITILDGCYSERQELVERIRSETETAGQQPGHCNHECVCCDFPSDIAPKQRCPRVGCEHDTRSRPHTQAPEQKPGCYITCPYDDLCANDLEKIQEIERIATLAALDTFALWQNDHYTTARIEMFKESLRQSTTAGDGQPAPESIDGPVTMSQVELMEHDEKIRNEVMDEFGILHGEDAKRFHEYLNSPPNNSPETKELVRRAKEMSQNELR